MKSILALAISLPLMYLLYQLFIAEVNDPIKYIFTITGTTAMFLLITTTMLSVFKFTKYRKTVGLGAFFYALLHFMNFIILDAQLDISFVIKESLDKPFVYLGMLAFAILLFMAITSPKKLFKKYSKYHKFIYLAILLTVAHFAIGQKAITVDYWWYFVIFVFALFMKIKQANK